MAPKRVRYLVGVALITIAVPIISLRIMSSMSKRPADDETEDGQLAPCPDSPNCVSSQATDPEHAIEALPYTGSAKSAMSALRRVIARDRSARVVSRDDHMLRAEYRSRIFRFVDDVDFIIDEDQGVIHFRSASRVGYSDMGANRKRMERIREEFRAEQARAEQ